MGDDGGVEREPCSSHEQEPEDLESQEQDRSIAYALMQWPTIMRPCFP